MELSAHTFFIIWDSTGSRLRYTSHKFYENAMKLLRPTSLILLLSLMATSHAKADDQLLEGLLVNNTITWFGRDFFTEFARHWRNQSVRISENIVIEELPSARRGTQVVIKFRDSIVFRTSVSGSRAGSRQVAAQSVPMVSARIRSQLMNRQTASLDLASEEF